MENFRSFRSDYSPVSTSVNDEVHTTTLTSKTSNPRPRSHYITHALTLILGVILGIIFVGVLPHIGSSLYEALHTPSTSITLIAPQLLTTRTFSFNSSFAAPPPGRGLAEPIWDDLIPNGLGYVRYPSTSSSLSVVSAFHQIHCLYTLRRAHYATANSTKGSKIELADFDFGLDREEHVGHCFEYLRQSLMCGADGTVEPAEHAKDGFLGWGFERKCGNYESLKDWAAEHRAFDGNGLLAHHGN